MILLDTNVLIYAFEAESPFSDWARQVIAEAVVGEGAMVNPVVLAELCVGDARPDEVADRILSWGVEITSLPASAAPVCAAAFRKYRKRVRETGKPVATMPLPDFFIGAHALVTNSRLATADVGRYKTYFRDVALVAPD
ncbi:MAG: PIN domain-containing protein [Wenzhouxiangella sp.]|nr:MAG: PIN domain-containing protein [Wenzhouxiangella sp.]